MAGARIPLTPAVHQMISVGPVPELADKPGEISFPIVRDMDTFCYERQHGADMEVGSYAHRPILHDPEEIPSIEQATLSPTELPFTSDDFDPQLEQALELMPDILGNPEVGIRYAINGLLSLTPDGYPILGESPEVGGLWSAAAVWVKEGPGVGRAGRRVDDRAARPRSTPTTATSRGSTRTSAPEHHVKSRTSEAFNKTYGIVHPGEQWASNRDVRLSPDEHGREGPGRGLLRDRRLGAAVLVRVQRRPARGVRRRRDAARRRVGLPLVVPDHQRRAPGDARAAPAWSTFRVRDLRRGRPEAPWTPSS